MKINSSISSPNILRWDSSTCDPFTLTCTRTHGRIPTSCRNDEMMKEACAKICGSAYECQDQTCYAQLLLYLTLIGIGDRPIGAGVAAATPDKERNLSTRNQKVMNKELFIIIKQFMMPERQS